MGILDRIGATFGGGEAAAPETVREELALAIAFADRGDLATAEERLAGLAESHPEAPSVFAALGEVRVRRRDDEGAVAAFGRAVDRDKDLVGAWLGLGEALTRLGRPDPARDAFRRVLSRTTEPAKRARAHAGRGRLARAAGLHAKAVRELRRAAELAPGDHGIEADLGRALLGAGDAEGWQWLHRAAYASLETGPDVSLVLEVAAAAPKPSLAESLLRGALPAVKPGPTRARLQAALARALAGKGSTEKESPEGAIEEARALATEALAGAPEAVEPVAAWRAVAAAAGDYREALRAAARERELGAPPAAEELVRLAIGAADREAIARAAEQIPADHPLSGPVGRFVTGDAGDEDLAHLAALYPGAEAGRFLARALAPGAAPHGNLYALLAYARDLAARTAELAPLVPTTARAAEALDRPLLVAVMGEFNAGKSSFVNALCGDAVAPVGVTPTTATINVLRHGPRGARVLYQDGSAEELGAGEVSEFLSALDDERAASVQKVEIFFPLEIFERMEIVDTPGLNALRTEHERVARAFLLEADAIVWLFALNQAAKATERDALGLAQGARKRVLGVLNKADQASPEELEAVRRHVTDSLGDRVEALLPFSARDALRARRAGDEGLLAASGYPALLAALEERFFREARALKRRTALEALGRFLDEARARLPSPPPAEATNDRLTALDRIEERLRGAVAAERVALKARLEAAFRQVAADLLEFVRPRGWPFGERRAEAADEEFVADALEDAVARASETTRRILDEATAGGPDVGTAAAIDRFRAYARGVLDGGVVDRFLREDLTEARGRIELGGLQRALSRRVPDPEPELFAPLAAAATAAYAAARAALESEARLAELRALLRRERIERPLEEIAAALAALGDAAE